MDERPAIAPIFTRTANHGRPIWFTAFAIGAGSFKSVYGTIPTSTADVRM
jgi:hypothetical protein